MCRYLIIGLIAYSVESFSSSRVGDGHEPCIQEASARYQVPELIIKSTIDVESSWDANAVNVNANGSKDFGLMQINEWWLRRLDDYGIGRHNIMNPCVNIHVGTWIIASNVALNGVNVLTMGAYNAGFSPEKDKARSTYVDKLVVAYLKRTKGAER